MDLLNSLAQDKWAGLNAIAGIGGERLACEWIADACRVDEHCSRFVGNLD